MEHFVVAVGERDVVVCDMALEMLDLTWLLGVGDGILRAENLIDAHHRGEAFLDGVHRLAEVFGRVDYGVENHHVVDEFRCVEARSAPEDERAAEPEHDGYGRGAEEFAHGVGERLAPGYAVAQPVVGLVLAMEAGLHLLFGIEGLDDAQSAETFLDGAHQYAPTGSAAPGIYV